MLVVPMGMLPLTVTAKMAWPVPWPAPVSAPMGLVQTPPWLPLGTQVQPGLLAPGLKVVLAGTVSVRTTPVASCEPALV